MSHALLSPSGASRWLACTPSARLEQQFPDRAGEAAAEGTLAHVLAELLIKRKLGRIQMKPYEKELAAIIKNDLYDAAMMDHCEDFAVYVIEQFHTAQSHTKDALLFQEVKLDLTDYVPEGFGTGDIVLIADTEMGITDLKYGKGVPVSAIENKQMYLYALGALAQYDFLYDIQTVRMTIYQPRIDNISDFVMTADGLRDWAERELKPKAALAFEGKGAYVPGDHCRFCRAKPVCKVHANMQMKLAQYDFAEPALLTDDEVVHVLDKAKSFTAWLKSITGYALKEALGGKKWPEMKLVAGRANRKYGDPLAVAKVLEDAGYSHTQIYGNDVQGLTKLTKELGAADFNRIIEPYLIKPNGKPTLVKSSDKRAEINSIDSAMLDFADDDEAEE